MFNDFHTTPFCYFKPGSEHEIQPPTRRLALLPAYNVPSGWEFGHPLMMNDLGMRSSPNRHFHNANCTADLNIICKLPKANGVNKLRDYAREITRKSAKSEYAQEAKSPRRLTLCRTKAKDFAMPIPPFEQNGLLSVGIHDCTLDEIKDRFGSFQNNDQRPKLFQKFLAFVLETRSGRFARSLLIDGSFVTAKPNPNDIDLVLVLPLTHDLTSDLSPTQYNVVSKRSVQRRYGFDIVAVRENTTEYDEATAFFQQVRGYPNLRKGLIRLLL
jgi:hypothetical protein